MANLDFNKNDDKMRLLISEMKRRYAEVSLGGGKKKIEKQHAKGKLTARERIDYLKDKDADFLEIGSFAGDGMYEEYGGCPSGGVVAGITYVKDRQCIVVANDATVKAGAWFPITGKKNLRLQEISMENRLPIIYLVDSAGVFLPMQDEIFPDKEHFGRIFRNNARMSSMGITQISAVMGSCAEECQKLIFPSLSFQVCRVRVESVVIALFASQTSPFTLADSTFRASPSEIPIAISMAEVPLFTCLILPSGRVMLIIGFYY